MTTARIPALSISAPLRYATFGALYFAQGIPSGLFTFAIPAWLIMQGVSALAIGGYLGTIMLPWTFKILAGPLIDRYGFLPMGRRRPWLIGAQLGLLISLCCLAFIQDAASNIGPLTAVAFLVNCFTAVQDVATDGLAVDILPIEERSKANGVMWGAKTLGISATLAGSTYLINHHGLSFAVLVLASVVAFIALLPIFLCERPGEKRLPWTSGVTSPEVLKLGNETWGSILMALKNGFLLRNSLLGAIYLALGGLAIGLKDALLPLFTVQQLGWANDAYANTVAGANMVSAIAAMLLAGWLAEHVGKVRIIGIYQGLIMAAWITLACTAAFWGNNGYIRSMIAVIQSLETFCVVAVFATAMCLCWQRVAATQFTLYMVCNNLGMACGGALLGPLKLGLNWSGMFLCMAGVLLVAGGLIQFMRLHAHAAALGRHDDSLRRAALREQNRPAMDLDVAMPVT